MILNSRKDLQDLQGKFVLRVMGQDPDKTLMDLDWQFAKENRLKLICGKSFVDLLGYIDEYPSFETFKDRFNGEVGTKSLFHRLLTKEELEYVLKKMIEDNY